MLKEFCGILDRLCKAYADRDADRGVWLGKHAKLERAEVICGDARQVLAKLRAGCVKLVVTSPPYFGVSDYIKAQRLSMEWFDYEIESHRIKEIGARSKRHRKLASDEYLKELTEIFGYLRRCLRSDGLCIVIIGESVKRKSLLAQFLEQLRACGLKPELDMNRRVSSLRRQLPSITSEHVLVLSK